MNTDKQKIMVRFYNASGTAWQFPDGTVIRTCYEAQRKADKLGMTLEQCNLRRFSNSH